MEIPSKCVKVFLKMDTLNERISQLGREAKLVLAQTINGGVGLESIDFLLAKAKQKKLI